MNEIKIFEKEEFGKIRTVLEKDTVWFVASDICKSLELTNTTMTLDRLDEDEKSKLNLGLSGGETNCVNEYGLYNLVLASRKQCAKEFKRWVTHEVLPSIRKNGIYATDKVIDDILNNPDFGIELLTKLKEERQARIKAEKTNAILMHVNKTYTATEIAKEIGLKSAKELNKWLEEKGIQYKVNDTWLPKADYSNCGYFEIKQEVLDTGKVIYHRRITQLGREFILNLTEKAI